MKTKSGLGLAPLHPINPQTQQNQQKFPPGLKKGVEEELPLYLLFSSSVRCSVRILVITLTLFTV